MGDTIQTIDDLDVLEVAHSFECEVSELKNRITVGKNDFSMISQNIRSIYKNLDDFFLSIPNLAYDTDVIILTECRIDYNKPMPQLANYQSYFTKSQLNQNDGVILYVKSTLKHKVNEIKLAQSSCLKLNILNTTILCIYRSPSNLNAESFINSLSNHLDTLNSEKTIIIAGDININIKLKPIEPLYEQRNRISYLNMLSVHGILAGHTIPTREKNCLDHFMLKINKKELRATIAVLHTSTTDHFTTFLTIAKIKDHVTAYKTRSTINYEAALMDLKTVNLSELLCCDNPNLVINDLMSALMKTIKENTIITNVPKKDRNIKPWITPGILRCIRNRNKLQKKVKVEPYNDINKITYIRYRNYCNNLIKKLKRKYERELLDKSVNNNKLMWKTIKNITYTRKINDANSELLSLKSSPTASADYVNDFFANIGKQIAQQIQPCTEEWNAYLRNLPKQNGSFVLLDTDQNEVRNILLSLKSGSAPGWDNIPTTFLKHVQSEIVPIITHLANLCFSQGIFPTALKQSIITPVYKAGDRGIVSNYRPISVLPAISKIIEKLLNSRLLNYLNKCKILSPSQFGFRQGKSTEDAVSALSSLVVEQLDNHKKCLSVFLDLQKAFDTVSIPILVHKLKAIGLRGVPLELFKDYLSSRRQRVKLDSYTSGDAEVSYGVPQGSVLGPTLFLIYINDLCTMEIKQANIFSYADDTAVVFSADSWEQVKEIAEMGLAHISRWLSNNLLTLNTAKTNYVCFSIYDSNQPTYDLGIRIHSCNTIAGDTNCRCPLIQRVEQTKYLGVYVDQRLSWYPHLEHVIARLRKLIWIFKTLRHVAPRRVAGPRNLNRNILTEIYVSLVQSVLVYCITVWGGAAKTRFIDLERAQRSLIKVMHFKNIRFPTVSLYQISGLFSVRKLYITQTISRKHKNLPYNPDIKNKRRKDIVAIAPRTNTVFASSQYTIRSAHLYNVINKEIYLYDKTLYECKKILEKWLEPMTYDDIETLLERR